MKYFIFGLIVIFFLLPLGAAAQNPALDKAKIIIKHYEGCALKAYKCPAGKLTIGYGNTTNAKPGKVISKEIADAYLSADLRRFEAHVNKNVRSDLEPNKKASLISLTFNCGYIIKDNLKVNINRGSPKLAAENIRKYNKAKIKGKSTVLRGLSLRRNSEATLYEFDYIDFERPEWVLKRTHF